MASSSASFSDSNSVSSGGRSATPNTLLSAPYAGRGSSADDSTPETWSLREGIIVPSLNHSLTFANYLASQIDDDIVIRFHFATDVDKEITVHLSRLNFVSGPLASLARHSDHDLGQDLVTLPDCDHPEVFYQIRRYLYGQPIFIAKMSLSHIVELALAAERWKLESLFNPVIHHLCRSPFPEPNSLQLASRLLLSKQVTRRLKTHLRAQLANYLSRSLQSTFPNAPDLVTTSLIRAFHGVDDLSLALEMAASQAPFLPLLHGLISALENIDDEKLRKYVHALPIAAAGLDRLFACDAATARWPPHAIRIVTSVATEATRDIARATVPLLLGKSTSLDLAGTSVSLSAACDTQGIGVSVCVRDSPEKLSNEDWKFTIVEIYDVACICGLDSLSGRGNALVIERENNLTNQSGVLRVDGKSHDWASKHSDCGETILSVSVELLTRRAAIFVRDHVSLSVDDSKRRGSLSTKDTKQNSKTLNTNNAQGRLSFSTLESRQNSGATNANGGDDERAGNSTIVWFVDY